MTIAAVGGLDGASEAGTEAAGHVCLQRNLAGNILLVAELSHGGHHRMGAAAEHLPHIP